MAQEVLISISLIIIISAVLAIIARIIKQPVIIAYLAAGILAGPLLLGYISPESSNIIQIMSRIGVAFLLFIVGMSLDYRLLKEIGKVSLLAGLAEIIAVLGLGFLIAGSMGYSSISSLYIGAALAFSSTVVVVKILSDKKELETLHGKISLGILIVQDIVASIFLMILPIIGKGSYDFNLFRQFGVAICLIVLVFVLSNLLFNRFLGYLASSQEALFLFGIAWALVLASVFFSLGFSIEIGALIAGMSLASSKYSLDISGKIKPLRDFFVVLFFVFFGSLLTEINFNLIGKALLLSAFVLIGKPLVIMAVLKVMGYTKRTNFMTSINLAQVSEFSLILILLGFQYGHLSQEIMNLSILVALITIGISTYFIYYSEYFVKMLKLKVFNLFDGKVISDNQQKKKSNEIILFGYHRIGYKLLPTLQSMSKEVLVVDYNPQVVLSLIKNKIDCIFGDAGNKNFLNEIGLDRAKLVISTIPDEQANLTIKDFLNEYNPEAAFIATTEDPRKALYLYKEGADYVIIPQHLGGEYASFMINKFKTNKKFYREAGKQHKKNLESGKKNSLYNI